MVTVTYTSNPKTRAGITKRLRPDAGRSAYELALRILDELHAAGFRLVSENEHGALAPVYVMADARGCASYAITVRA